MAIKALIPFLVAMMLVTGVCNTLLTKYQDMQCVRNCDSDDPKQRHFFEQPVIQTAQMFIGEMGCWLVVAGMSLYKRFISNRASLARNGGYLSLEAPVESHDSSEDGPDLAHSHPSQEEAVNASAAVKSLVAIEDDRQPLIGWRIILLGLPACCDITGTTLMNVGLLYVAASIYQMTRGALVLFVGLFSVVFLRTKLHIYQWSALTIVVIGVAIVGLAGAIFKDHKATPGAQPAAVDLALTIRASLVAAAKTPETLQTIIGIFLIAAAQIFTASQFVLEEWILEHYALEPLKVVGWEGVFGFLLTTFGMLVLHLAIGRTPHGRFGYFDANEGLREVTEYRSIAVSSILIMISIGGFNYFGLSVTRTVSATSRSTIDTCRTLFIWMVSLGLGWETFKWLQVVGFALLVYGTFLFNDIVRPPLRACLPAQRRPELIPQ
ncbi:MAG: hypothetical protein M1829_003469 [Trizodia sp. TS-e1964]|nr:MAG: hypothetical protein M1829_003469 [Trizodia sp. TS-e1964]